MGLAEHLAEHHEVVLAGGRGVVEHRRDPRLPEPVRDVLDRVDPEPVDVERVDHVGMDVDHAVDHDRVLVEQVIEAEEVAVLAVLAGEGGVAPVVVVDRVVEPIGALRLFGDHRGVGETGGGVELGEGAGALEVAVVEGVAVGVDVGEVRLVPVLGRALGVVDEVARVVQHHVEQHLDAAGVGVGHEGLHLGVGSVVGIDLGEVGLPVAVVRRRHLGAGALDVVVLERGCDPDGADAETLDVVELRPKAGDVAAVVVALVRGVEAVDGAVAGETRRVVGSVAVGEPVGHHEVHGLIGGRSVGRRDEGLVAGFGGVGIAVGIGSPATPAVGGDREHVGGRHEREGDGVAVGHREGDVGAVGHAARAIVLVPGPVDGGLALIGAGRDIGGGEGVGAVTVDVGQPRPHAFGLPVAGAAEGGLETAGGGHDSGVDVVGDPVGVVGVVEGDVGVGGKVEGDVGAVALGPGAVVLVPRVVERCLVLPGPGRHREGAGPDVAVGFVRQLGVGALGLPVIRAAQLGLQAAGHGDRTRCRRVVGGGRRERHGGEAGHERRHGQHDRAGTIQQHGSPCWYRR